MAADVEGRAAVEEGEGAGPDDEAGLGEVFWVADVVVVDVGEHDDVDVGGGELATGEGGDDVGHGGHGLAGLAVFLEDGRIEGDVVAEAEVEDDTCEAASGEGFMLDEEGHGGDGEFGVGVGGDNEELLGDGERACVQCMDCDGGHVES